MKPHPVQFMGPEEPCDLESARTVIVPFGYEGGVSYGRGTGQAPLAVLQASHYVELYDEVLETEPYQTGLATVDPGAPCAKAEEMIDQIRGITGQLPLHQQRHRQSRRRSSFRNRRGAVRRPRRSARHL